MSDTSLGSLLTVAAILAATSVPSAQEAPPLERGDDGVVRFAAWQEPHSAFEVRDTFINSEFLSRAATTQFPANAVMGFSEGTCPVGWNQLTADDGAPLFFAFGLLVDAEGTPRSEFVKIPACVKQE